MPPLVAVDLYWLPLGAGGHSVLLNSRVCVPEAACLGLTLLSPLMWRRARGGTGTT